MGYLSSPKGEALPPGAPQATRRSSGSHAGDTQAAFSLVDLRALRYSLLKGSLCPILLNMPALLLLYPPQEVRSLGTSPAQ
jgi:hypothetical protein